jgi:hypothetical protein
MLEHDEGIGSTITQMVFGRQDALQHRHEYEGAEW